MVKFTMYGSVMTLPDFGDNILFHLWDPFTEKMVGTLIQEVRIAIAGAGPFFQDTAYS